jgi:hypothetical protein
MTIDTIFLCYCEDSELNDGVERPYYMSRDLMKVMLELKSAGSGEQVFEGLHSLESGAHFQSILKDLKFSH